MNRLPRQTGDPLCVSFPRIPNRVPSERIPEPNMTIVSTGRDDPFSTLPLGAQHPTLVSHQGVFRQLDLHIPESCGRISRSRHGISPGGR